MLLSFSASNYRSFREEQTLNLFASKRLAPPGSGQCCKVPGVDQHVLRTASLYGANGAGKSNLVRAIRQLEKLVCTGTDRDEPLPHDPFKLDGTSQESPTTFEVQFLQDEEVFRYGICFDRTRIVEEWLGVYERKRERSLFTRTTSDEGQVRVELGPAASGANGTPQLKALALAAHRGNQPFLAEVLDRDEPGVQGARLRGVVDWFEKRLKIIEPNASFVALIDKLESDEAFADFAGSFLREASTGISNLEIESHPILESQLRALPPDALGKVEDGSAAGRFVLRPRLGEEIVKGPGDEVFTYRRIMASHGEAGGEHTSLPLSEESDGSQRLLNLLPALHELGTQGGVFVIDELERSMHPTLARKFVEFFSRAGTQSHSQLIFTTHESNLLDLDLMRRDGIWFCEKDGAGATHLYSLAEFKVRNDLRIDKGYLAGRFGAIPFLGGIDQLLEEREPAQAEQ